MANSYAPAHQRPLIESCLSSERMGSIFGNDGDTPIDDLGLVVHLRKSPGLKNSGRPAGEVPLSRGSNLSTSVPGDRRGDQPLYRLRPLLGRPAVHGRDHRLLYPGHLVPGRLHVIGFLWPNGERDSGKTHLLSSSPHGLSGPGDHRRRQLCQSARPGRLWRNAGLRRCREPLRPQTTDPDNAPCCWPATGAGHCAAQGTRRRPEVDTCAT